MTAIFTSGGKQFKVVEGDIVYLEKLELADGAKVKFDVLALFEGDKITMGTPIVSGATVEAKVIKSDKQRKIIVYKMKAKKNYRKKQGHRQPYTKVQIEKIIGA